MHNIQGNLRKNGEFINNQGGALLHHNSPILWSTFAQYLTPVAFAKVYTEKNALIAAEMLNEQVLPCQF
jgi:hypothetical protein